jgi:hypothetical protein
MKREKWWTIELKLKIIKCKLKVYISFNTKEIAWEIISYGISSRSNYFESYWEKIAISYLVKSTYLVLFNESPAKVSKLRKFQVFIDVLL